MEWEAARIKQPWLISFHHVNVSIMTSPRGKKIARYAAQNPKAAHSDGKPVARPLGSVPQR